MNREETMRAMEILAASPAARWVGNRIDGATLTQKCTRCGAEQTLEMPGAAVRAHQGGQRGDDLAAHVPTGFDEELFAWKRAFQVAHEGCAEVA